MPVYGRKKMCKECPFRLAAPSGWLGPWTPEQMIGVIRQDQNLICHTDVAKLQKRGLTIVQIEGRGQHCVGAMRYMNQLHKLSRDQDKAIAQCDLNEVEDQPVIPADGFTAFHCRRV